METEIMETEQPQTELAKFDPKELAERAALRLDQHSKFLKVFYSYLDPTCIDFFGDEDNKKARWNWRACNQAINVFGITVKIIAQDGKPYYKDEFEDGEGKYYIFCHHAEASVELPDGRILAVKMPGYFSTRDQFFGKAYGKVRAIEAVDIQDVIRASATEARKKAVFALLGLGEPTKEDLQKLGVKVDIINTVEFSGGTNNAQAQPKSQPSATSAPSSNLITEKQQKKIYAMLKQTNFTVDEFKFYLSKYHQLEPDADGKVTHKIRKDQLQEIFAWLDENKKEAD